MARFDRTDAEWAPIEPLLPTDVRGKDRVDDQRVRNGVFWQLGTSAPWADIPARCGSLRAMEEWASSSVGTVSVALARAGGFALNSYRSAAKAVPEKGTIAEVGPTNPYVETQAWLMSKRIAIIGGGWYGCHIASSLMSLGFSTRLFEKNERLLHDASGNNQFRLHLGFHYARHAGTRIQSRDGFSRFMERYGDLSRPVEENIYAVPRGTSLIDFDTYRLIMTATGIPYNSIERCSTDLRNVDGMMRTDERVLLVEKARHYFTQHLRHVLSLSINIESVEHHDKYVTVNGERFDYVVDATWGHFSPVQIETYFEPTLLLYFEAAPGLPALTFVDGPLYSIYPTEDRCVYTLSSVPHTPLGRFNNAKKAQAVRDEVNADLVKSKLRLMIDQAMENVPSFSDQYKFIGPQISIKTKPVGNSDDRSCYVGRSGRMFTVMSGKIDTIFFATERILSMIEADYDDVPQDVSSSLLSSIRMKSFKMGIENV